MRNWFLLLATALVAGGCQILSFQWVTPVVVPVGRLFTMDVTGQTNGVAGTAGIVFQVPSGFTVLDASTTVPNLVRDEPALLALYTPDPGHHLASFSRSGSVLPATNVALKVYLQAPPAPGSYQLEMALASGTSAGAFTPQLGLHSFQAPGGSAVRTVQVNAVPAPPPFALAAVFPDVVVQQVRDLDGADVDRDGRDDLVLLTPSGFVMRRSIPGGFAAPAAPVPSNGPQRDCAPADCDGDGFVDLAVSSGSVWFGDGGTSWTQVPAQPGDATHSVAAGDVDGDGLDDLAFASAAGIVVVRGQANRTFVPWSTGLPSGGPAGGATVEVVDLDADGRGELVVTFESTSLAPSVYRSTIAGVWSLVGSLPSGRRVVAVDVDGDGTKELLPSGTGQLFAYSPQGLVLAGTTAVTTFAMAVVLDFDRDGRDDVALGVSDPTTAQPRVELWRNAGGVLQAAPLPAWHGFDGLLTRSTLVVADFDDDSFPDLAAALDRALAWHNTQQGTAPFGEPCSAPSAVAPDLSVVGSVAPGGTAVLQLANALPLGGTLLWLGHSRTWWSGQPLLPFDLGQIGAPGCTLLAEPLAIVVAIANGSGVASLPCNVPLFPPTAEATVFVQGAVLAPAANPLGLLFSRGLALKIQ